MITIEQVRTAQRTEPLSEATKAMQREYEAQVNAAKRAERAKEHLAERAVDAAEDKRLREAITALSLPAGSELSSGMKLVAITRRTAEYYGMAPKTVGGWVAVSLPIGDYQELFAALVPQGWDASGALSPRRLRTIWLETAIDNEDLADALAKLSDLAE